MVLPPKFIAFAGVMGVGKSSLAHALASMTGATAFVEPGAEAWPVPAGEPWEAHVMALEQWVRETNLALFSDARKHADHGATAIADGGFFLLAKELIFAPSCQYYYGLFNQAEIIQLNQWAHLDWQSAPCPDILVLIEADITCWRKFLSERGRSMDSYQGFIDSYACQKDVMRLAAEKYAADKNIKLISFVNKFGDIQASAKLLQTQLNLITV